MRRLLLAFVIQAELASLTLAFVPSSHFGPAIRYGRNLFGFTRNDRPAAVGIGNSFSKLARMSVVQDQGSAVSKLKDEFWNWNGYKIRYQAAGLENKQGPSILLVHGFGGNADHWRKNTPELAKMVNARVFAIDLIGYGYSDKPDPQSMSAINGELRRDLNSYARFAPKVLRSLSIDRCRPCAGTDQFSLHRHRHFHN
jgi:hypothetical protein